MKNQDIEYNPGDILVIYPKNNKNLIQKLCELLNLDPQKSIRLSKNILNPIQFNSQLPQILTIYELFE